VSKNVLRRKPEGIFRQAMSADPACGPSMRLAAKGAPDARAAPRVQGQRLHRHVSSRSNQANLLGFHFSTAQSERLSCYGAGNLLAGGPSMPQVAQELRSAFYELGVELGRLLAERMLEGGEELEDADDGSPRPPPSKPRLLPGLSGRRRLPGEAPPLCGRPGCDRPSRTRGYCQTHYVQWLKAGADRSVG
jgi:hypothetical protein